MLCDDAHINVAYIWQNVSLYMQKKRDFKVVLVSYDD